MSASSLIAAAVTFVMGQNVGRSRLTKQKFHGSKDLTSHTRIGCDGSSKGLFLGILCMVAGIVVILIFLVVREDENFPSATLSWLTCGTLIGILTLSSLMTASGLVQVRQISVVTRAPAALDILLSNVSLFGVQLYSVFTIVVCACSLAMSDETEDTRARHIMLLSTSILQLVQCFAQSTLIAETSRRTCITRFQMLAKPGRQVITFLLFSNAVLWAFDTVITQNWLSQDLQLRFFGVLAWGVLSRIGLPLLIFYRFHSCVLLLEAWNKCYRMPRGEHPLNWRRGISHRPLCRFVRRNYVSWNISTPAGILEVLNFSLEIPKEFLQSSSSSNVGRVLFVSASLLRSLWPRCPTLVPPFRSSHQWAGTLWFLCFSPFCQSFRSRFLQYRRLTLILLRSRYCNLILFAHFLFCSLI